MKYTLLEASFKESISGNIKLETIRNKHQPRYIYDWTDEPKPRAWDGLCDALPVGKNEVLLQFSEQNYCINWKTLELTTQWEVPNAKIIGVSPAHILYYLSNDNAVLGSNKFLHYHRQLKEWSFECNTAFAYRFGKEGLSEDTYLVDYKAKSCLQLEEIPDYPVRLANSLDQRYCWVETKEAIGGVYDLETGNCVLESENFSNYDDVDNLPSIFLEGSLMEKLPYSMYAQSSAVAKTSEHFWLFDGQFLLKNMTPILEIKGLALCANFSLDGQELILASDQQLIILRLNEVARNLEEAWIAIDWKTLLKKNTL
ncbi:MAG: hypothetical protein GY810_03145 [Aureispira sp.]|nr:hypothetical protein [Aureispira sp.]